jgi:N-formylglutamate amidohydrolase
VAVALHHGHDVRREVAEALAVDGGTRLREEDPYTGVWTALAPTRVVVHRSRFEVDLNRPRSGCVFTTPEAAWGIDVWGGRVTDDILRYSARLHDMFYRCLAGVLRRKADTEGAFIVFDLHSYNHRREGPDGPVADALGSPDVNVGTGHLDRSRWAAVVEAFILAASLPDRVGRIADVRENVRFEGGYLTQWVSERFPTTGCALAIEVKKTFMDEWTGALDSDAFRALGARLARTTGPVQQALRTIESGGRSRPARRQAR